MSLVCSVLSWLRLVSLFHFSFLLLPFAEAARPRLEVTGEVGGSVSINCPTIPNKPIGYFYFQRKVESVNVIFVNGFFTGLSVTPTKPNSRLDEEKNTTVHMFDLTMADDGAYECRLEYTDGETSDTDVYINVTGKYDALFKPLGFCPAPPAKNEMK